METIKQSANEYAVINDDKCSNSAKAYDKYDLAIAFISGVEFAQRWISVEEKLPESGELVLVAIENCFIDVVCARIISGKWNCRLYVPTRHPDFIIEDNITHWRPINLE